MKTLKIKTNNNIEFIEFENEAELIALAKKAKRVDRSDTRYMATDTFEQSVAYLTSDAQWYEINETRSLEEVVEAVRSRLSEEWTMDEAELIVSFEFRFPETSKVGFDRSNVLESL